MNTRKAVWTCLLVVALAAGLGAQAKPGSGGYLTPPKAIVDILDARPTPMTVLSPTNTHVAIVERRSMPTIADLAEPMLRLGGTRINPKTNGPHITSGAMYAIALKRVSDGAETKVVVPPNARLGSFSFSPDGKRLAFTNTTATGIALWVANTATGAAAQVVPAMLNATGGNPCQWLDDGKQLLCRLVVATRGPAPAAPTVPTGPNIQENVGKAAPVSTYQDLLETEHDERLFEYYFTSQLALVNAATGARTPIGKPAIFEEVSASPNGEYLLVSRLKRPYSRLVPANGFPKDVEIWTRTGKLVKVIADLPSSETVPMLGVQTGPRSYRWIPTEPATLIWVEALDQGDLRNQVPSRDRLVTLKAPFTDEPGEMLKLEHRFQGIAWTEGGLSMVSEFNRSNRVRRTWLLEPGASPRKIWELSSEERYKDPGTPVTRSRRGQTLVMQVGSSIFLHGAGASPKGDFPFLDRLDLKTLNTERIWQCQGESYETVVAILDEGARTLLTRYETSTDPPNLYVRDLASNGRRAVTAFPDPAPQLRGVQKQFVTYQRKDGVALSGTLYLPPGYQKGQKLPVIMWAYPREFTDPATAGQVTGSQYRFTTVSGASHMLLLTQGYAIFDDPKMPIIGPGETANDRYVEQLIASAEAAVDKLVEMGVADRDRVGVGGHSYGAFMTANLLAHSRLFRAGVARSGAYNRSLTPFGFQSERRTFWEVPQVYANMSPFWFAHQVKDPILLIHGEADNNSGTFPIQSERFYMALKGHGATVRYVTLPLESHGYSARESVFHTVTEMLNWFDKYVKNAGPRGTDKD
ncbi:MAG: prolyl oligopeptidase family serine peptidase [Vicinamibacterales bacterium]